MKQVLITGLNSLIGWHCFKLANKILPTVGTYRRACAAFRHENCYFIDLDDQKTVRNFLEYIRPTHIIHARSMCDLDVCQLYPDLTARVNIAGTEIMLREAECLDSVQKFCYVSTDHVFDGERGWYIESDRPRPKHVYGHTKLVAENLVRLARCPWLIVRPGLAIGESAQGTKGPHDWLLTRLNKGKASHLFCDEWRTPIMVSELAQSILELVFSERVGVYHIAGAKRISRYDLGLAMARRAGVPDQNVKIKYRAEDRLFSIRPKELTLRSQHLNAISFEI